MRLLVNVSVRAPCKPCKTLYRTCNPDIRKPYIGSGAPVSDGAGGVAPKLYPKKAGVFGDF